SMRVNAAGGFLRIARGLWRLCCFCTNSLVEAVQALAAASAAASSGERTRPACWLWRFAKTGLPGKVRDRVARSPAREARALPNHYHFLICSGNGHCAQSEL